MPLDLQYKWGNFNLSEALRQRATEYGTIKQA